MFLALALQAVALPAVTHALPREPDSSAYRCIEPVPLDPSWAPAEPDADPPAAYGHVRPREPRMRMRSLAEGEMAPGVSADLFHVRYGGGWGSDVAVGVALALPF